MNRTYPTLVPLCSHIVAMIVVLPVYIVSLSQYNYTATRPDIDTFLQKIYEFQLHSLSVLLSFSVARNVFVQIVLQFVIRHQIICQIDRKGGILFFNINPRVLKFCMGKDKHFWKYKQQCIVRLVKTTVDQWGKIRILEKCYPLQGKDKDLRKILPTTGER